MFRPVSPACNELWDAQDRAATDAAFHVRTPLETLEIQQRRVQSALDRFFQPSGGREFDPGQVAAGILVALMVLLGAGAAWFLISLRQIRGLARRRAIQGVVFVLPWLAGLFVFVLGPMIASAFLAFTEYDVIHPPRWVGTGNWARMFGLHQGSEGLAANDPQFWRGLWNTFYITLAGVPVGMAVSLAIALLLKAEVRGIHLYRTLYYVPVMVPAVVTALIWMWMLNPESGFANFALNRLLHPLGLSAPNWFGDPEWAKPGLILLLVWGCGGTVIIWLAGLHTLPRHLYEAATIDGAGSWRRFLHITLPLLTPYILFLWIMGTIGSLQIFAQAYIINPPGDSLLFYAVYLFFRAFRYFEMGYACAMAWVLFVITAFICIWQIRVSKRWVHYETEL
jgi:multiple sugar transport system permease protein